MASHLKPQLNFTLYRGFTGSGAYVWSPFVTKLEARLRFAGLSYRVEAGSLGKAPKGKIPYLAVTKPDAGSQAPTVLSDTALISQKLVEDGVLDDLNAKLSPTEKAHDLAIQALLEDKLYFYQNYERWHENYYTMRGQVLAALPYPMQVLIGLLAYRGVSRTLHGQGTMRFSTEEISSFRKHIWENVNALIVASKKKAGTSAGDEVFWLWGGKGPSEADTTLFGFIAPGLICAAAPETQQVVRSFPAVVDYAQRIHNRYFPDYPALE